ncbi:MAG: hypothetical protein WC010_00075 [Candidatus Absconditabacterales bacterium]
MIQKIKKFLFSKSAIITLFAIYLIIAVGLGTLEYLNGASIRAVLFLRGGAIILDFAIVGLGVYTFTRKWLDKKFLKKDYFRKRLFWLAYIAETLAIFILFYVPYVGRALYLVIDGEKIGMSLSWHAFIINLILGFVFMIVLGAKMKKIIGNLEEKTKKNTTKKKSNSTS